MSKVKTETIYFHRSKEENWELAVYPLEAHSFTRASSWTDEYKRIWKLFKQTLL